jgi:hypothetical protein
MKENGVSEMDFNPSCAKRAAERSFGPHPAADNGGCRTAR